jgi:phage terminase large subunit-like protein
VIAARLFADLGKERAKRAVDVILAQFSMVELAALAAHWQTWARPKQFAPAGEWRSWGFLTARGFGKTKAIAHHINDEVQAGRAMCIGLAAQNEAKTIAVQIASLIETAPPWFRPRWEASKLELVWPNGARAYAFSPEVPGAIRSPNFYLCWLSELQSWPTATREEAYSNFLFATRIGYARTIWDATPKKRHPILQRLLARAEREPGVHLVVRGTIYENAANLGRGVIQNLENEYGGTQKGREELLGEMLEDSENALVRQVWIDDHRRSMPSRIVRRVIGIDPAVTNRAGNDRTGLVEDGLDTDGQLLVLGDYSGQHSADAWAKIVIDNYVNHACDCVVVETNKGGDLVTQNLRAHADRRNLSVIVLGKLEKWKPHNPKVIYVREVHARGAKEDRAQPLATAYERGRVSHIVGADLGELEATLTTWEPAPGQRSPNAINAHVHAATELLGLLTNTPDGKASFVGIDKMGAALEAPAIARDLAALLGGGRGDTGGRI